MRAAVAFIMIFVGIACSSVTPVPPAPSPTNVDNPVALPPGPGPTFTFTIDPACSARFPEDVRIRSYSSPGYGYPQPLSGTFEQSAGVSWNVLYFSQKERTAGWYFNDPPIWERLSSEAYLIIYGGSEYGGTSPYGEWPAFGHFTYCERRKPGISPECAVPEITCNSNRHRLRVARNE
jgi:hypothetical protein